METPEVQSLKFEIHFEQDGTTREFILNYYDGFDLFKAVSMGIFFADCEDKVWINLVNNGITQR